MDEVSSISSFLYTSSVNLMIKEPPLAESISLMMALRWPLLAAGPEAAWSETNTNIERAVVKYILTKINTNLLLPRLLQNIEHTSRANFVQSKILQCNSYLFLSSSVFSRFKPICFCICPFLCL